METDLEILAATIRAHAREQAGKEWETEYRAILMQILANVGLAKEVSTHNYRAEGTLTLGDREVPTEAIIKALHERFLTTRTLVLTHKLTEQIVKTAARKVIDDEETS